MIGVKLNMPRHKAKTNTGTTSRRRRAPTLTTREQRERFHKKPHYKRGDIIKCAYLPEQRLLILDVKDKKNYYQYYWLILNTGQYDQATAWHYEETLIQHYGELPPPLA